jgi:hypothetical protein
MRIFLTQNFLDLPAAGTMATTSKQPASLHWVCKLKFSASLQLMPWWQNAMSPRLPAQMSTLTRFDPQDHIAGLQTHDNTASHGQLLSLLLPLFLS